MHIALLTLSYPPQTGGVQTYLAELMRRVARHHRVTVITPVPGNGPEPAGIRRLVVPMSLAPWFWLGLLRTRPDRVVVGHVHPQLLLAARLYTPCRFIALAYGNDYLATQKRWHRPVTNRLLAQARPLITISQANAAQLRSLGLPEPEIIYPGTDPDRFYPPQQRPAGPVLLTVSRLVPRKGIDRVILALSELVNDFPDLSYHIVGDGYDWGRLAQIADNADVWEAVGFFSGVSDEGLRQHYQESTLFVMPVRDDFYSADREGFGIVYLEAAACGLPVIAGRSGGAVEAVQDGVTGFLVDPIFIGELKEKISLLLTDRELAQRMGAAGRRWVETEMNWDRAAQQLLDILENGP